MPVSLMPGLGGSMDCEGSGQDPTRWLAAGKEICKRDPVRLSAVDFRLATMLKSFMTLLSMTSVNRTGSTIDHVS